MEGRAETVVNLKNSEQNVKLQNKRDMDNSFYDMREKGDQYPEQMKQQMKKMQHVVNNLNMKL